MAKIVQLVLVMKPDGKGQVFQELVGLDDRGRLWRKQLGSPFSLEWSEWVLDRGETIGAIEAVNTNDFLS